MTHRGPFQPLPFCDSVILWKSTPSQFWSVGILLWTSISLIMIITSNSCAILTNITPLAEKIRDKVNEDGRRAANTYLSWKQTVWNCSTTKLSWTDHNWEFLIQRVMSSFCQPLLVLMIPNLDMPLNKDYKSQGIIYQSQSFFFFSVSCMYFRLQFAFSIQ